MRRLGHHELLIRLASGGAANVFLTRDLQAPAPGRLLALKVLLPQLAENEDFRRMFFTEAKIASKIHHPNVVQIAGFGQADGIHCLAMEYVFGASLAQVLRASARARRPLTVGVLLRITAQVCDALHHAHELRDKEGRPMGVVHRDVTPQNIIIGFNGVPKLTDFGIAKATDRGWETQVGIVKGKFSYMSPEQALAKKVDRRTDIFCTGIVLWEALTGRELFKGSTPLEVIENIRKQTIPPPSKVVPGLSPIVDPIVMKALRRSPRQRYQTAGQMRDDIEKLIQRAGVSIDAKTISQEFAEIFGDVIYRRAFALRGAMAGGGDLDDLAELMGGGKLRDEHLPVIPGGANEPDILGLFEDVDEVPGLDDNGVEELAMPAMPARADEKFDDVDVQFDNAEPEVTAEEEMQFEIEEDATAEQSPELVAAQIANVDGWDDSTRMMVPDDELLSMLSEEDATIGMVPEEWRARFGGSLETVSKDEGPVPNAGFDDDEETVDASSFDQVEATIADDRGPQLFDAKQVQARVVRDELADREPPRSESSLIESSRPVPRAPSLDMRPEDLTPPPKVEPVSPRGTKPPPPPPSTNYVPEPRPLTTESREPEPDDDMVVPGELEAPAGEREPSRPRPELRQERSAPYSSSPPQPAVPSPHVSHPPQPARPDSKQALAGAPSNLSADSLRELASGRPQSQYPSPHQAPHQAPPMGSRPPASSPGYYQGPPSQPGMPPGYVHPNMGSHPGYMMSPPTPSSQHGVVVRQRTSKSRSILWAVLAVLLIGLGVLLGVVFTQKLLPPGGG